MVDEAFVFGLATINGDQSVGCVLISPVAPEDRDELACKVKDWARERAAAYKVPETIRVITAGHLPLTPTGKVSKKLLREQTQASLE
jgi:acyl-CoA synthetase (AMP-forming)/AMP-acid ligase II